MFKTGQGDVKMSLALLSFKRIPLVPFDEMEARNVKALSRSVTSKGSFAR